MVVQGFEGMLRAPNVLAWIRQTIDTKDGLSYVSMKDEVQRMLEDMPPDELEISGHSLGASWATFASGQAAAMEVNGQKKFSKIRNLCVNGYNVGDAGFHTEVAKRGFEVDHAHFDGDPMEWVFDWFGGNETLPGVRVCHKPGPVEGLSLANHECKTTMQSGPNGWEMRPRRLLDIERRALEPGTAQQIEKAREEVWSKTGGFASLFEN